VAIYRWSFRLPVNGFFWFTAEDCFLEKAGTQNLAVRLDREQRHEQADTAKNKDCLWRFTVNVCSGYSRNGSNNCSHA
jgi:hypothetical protein